MGVGFLSPGSIRAKHLALKRVDEARATIEAGLVSNPDNAGIHWQRYAVAYLQGDQMLMQREFDWGASRPAGDNFFLWAAALAALQHGELRKARDLESRYFASTGAAKLKENSAQA